MKRKHVVITVVVLALLVSFSLGCRQIWHDAEAGLGEGTDIGAGNGSGGNGGSGGSTTTKSIVVAGPVAVDVEHSALDVATFGEYFTIELTATSSGVDTVDLTRATWSSSDTTLATVSGTGSTATVEGKSAGDVTITVTATDGTSQDYTVKVYESFVLEWDLSGATPNADGKYELELPLNSEFGELDDYGGIQYAASMGSFGKLPYGGFNVMVDWGDGSTPQHLVNNDYSWINKIFPIHEYDNPGSYVTRIYHDEGEMILSGWSFGDASVDTRNSFPSNNYVGGRTTSVGMLSDILRFGSTFFKGYGLFAYYEGAGFSAHDLKLNYQAAGVLYKAINFNQDISSWELHNMDSLIGFFAYATAYNNEGQPLNWDVSNVIYMSWMFDNATSFVQDLSGWDVSSVNSTYNFDYNTSPSWTASMKPNFP